MWQMLIGIAWINIGLISSSTLPDTAPKRLGRFLFWVGAPLQIFALAHKSNFDMDPWLPAFIVICVLGLGWGIALLTLRGLDIATVVYWPQSIAISPPEAQGLNPVLRTAATDFGFLRFPFGLQGQRSPVKKQGKGWQGSFVLASMLGNTTFLGMAVIPPLVDPKYLGWVVIFGIIHYIFGSYGVGIVLANYYGQSKRSTSFRQRGLHLIKVPAFWAFILGYLSQSMKFWPSIDSVLQGSLWAGAPMAFLLLGMQLGKLDGLNQMWVSIFPALIKTLMLPGLIGLGLLTLGFGKDACFAIVLMTGMPTSFSNLILAEEYNLNPQLAAGSIVLSTIILPLTIPLWYVLFHS